MFFLKALDDHEELRALLQREIDARTSSCSVTAKPPVSRGVHEEHEYVRSLAGKRVATITLAAAWEKQLATIDTMLKLTTAFLSYAHIDRDRVLPFADLLADYDMAVWTDLQLQTGQSWAASIEAALRKAAEDGYLVAFLSAASLRSQWVASEMRSAPAMSAQGLSPDHDRARARGRLAYLASVNDCRPCPLKARCCLCRDQVSPPLDPQAI